MSSDTIFHKKEKNELLEFKNILDDDKRRDNYFRNHGDSYNHISWNDFIKIVEDYGFVCGYFREFEGESKITEKEAIYYLKEKGLILHLYTNGGISVETATLWGQLYAPEECDLTKHRGLSGFTYVYNGCTKAMEFFLNVTDGFVYRLDTLIMNFEFFVPWKTMGLMNLTNYMERKYKADSSFTNISYNKVQNSCKDIIDIVFGRYLII